jgi:hypothetical protein
MPDMYWQREDEIAKISEKNYGNTGKQQRVGTLNKIDTVESTTNEEADILAELPNISSRTPRRLLRSQGTLAKLLHVHQGTLEHQLCVFISLNYRHYAYKFSTVPIYLRDIVHIIFS